MMMQPFGPLPSRAQLLWQRCETNLFVHFGVNTFTDREWGDGTEDPRIFNPAKLDCRQWARAAKAGGFKIVILTAKHHDGFCLWPSRYTDHSVKSSPWRNGKGDVVREFVDACRAEGIQPGLYLSPWDRHEKTYGDSPKYNDYYCNQLHELLTGYGPLAEVWFDGACAEGPNGRKQAYDWPRIFRMVKDLQPEAVTFGDGGTDVRWVGNESGFAGEECWGAVNPELIRFPGDSGNEQATDARAKDHAMHSLHHGDKPDGQTPRVWRPAESDVSIRPGWFYHAHEDEKVRSVENLVDLYFKSVGRNSLILLNVPPTRDGLFHETDAGRLAAFRQALDSHFRSNLATGATATASLSVAGCEAMHVLDGNAETYWAAPAEATSPAVEIILPSPKSLSVICLQEPVQLGQRIAAYRVECMVQGQWRTVARGTTIGHKKLDRFEPATTDRVRVTVEASLTAPALSKASLY
jgi:alpha-L-fucosidase